MSWDIFVMNIPPEYTRLKDVPKNIVLEPLGSRSELIGKISKIYPECNFSDPSWGILEHPDCVIEFSIKNGPQNEDITDCKTKKAPSGDRLKDGCGGRI
jgi:hypothetical protein